MVRKILSSLLIVSITTIFIGLGSHTYFSDTEASKPYMARSGSIDIQVEWPNSNNIAELSFIPSQVQYLREKVTNIGRNPVVLYKRTNIKEATDGVVTGAERLEGTNPNGNYVPKFDIDKVILYDLSVIRDNGNKEIIIPDPTDGETGPVLADFNSKWIKIGLLEPGESVEVIQSYHMKKSTTNWAANDTIAFAIDFIARQVNDGSFMDTSP